MKPIDNVDINGMKIELLGTFMYTYVGGWSIIHSKSQSDTDNLAPALSHMFTLCLLIWSAAHVTGGHFNPAVTSTLVIFKRCNWVKGLFYIASQFVGALFASSCLKVLLPYDVLVLLKHTNVLNGFSKIDPSLDNIWLKNLIFEVIGTFFIVTMVYMTMVHEKAPENVHGVCIGGTIGFCMLAAPLQLAVGLNPARAIMPLFLESKTNGWWLLKWGWIW